MIVSVYPVASSREIIFPGFNILEKPEYVNFLEDHYNLGERIGIDGGYDFNVYTSIPQSGGGNIHYVYMINEFAYTFWYYMTNQESRNSTYLPYFARSYNTRWFKDVQMPGLRKVYPGIYEVEDFNSSFVEVIRPRSIVALFIGDYSEYRLFFTSIAMMNPEDIIPVYGGITLEGYDLEVLRNFDVIYLRGLRDRSEEVLTVLSEYINGGGGLILDSGDDKLSDVPEPFPVSETDTDKNSHLNFSQTIPHQITKDVNFTKFYTAETYPTSLAVRLKDEAVNLVYNGNGSAVSYWPYGSGKALWTGLRFPI